MAKTHKRRSAKRHGRHGYVNVALNGMGIPSSLNSKDALIGAGLTVAGVAVAYFAYGKLVQSGTTLPAVALTVAPLVGSAVLGGAAYFGMKKSAQGQSILGGALIAGAAASALTYAVQELPAYFNPAQAIMATNTVPVTTAPKQGFVRVPYGMIVANRNNQQALNGYGMVVANPNNQARLNGLNAITRAQMRTDDYSEQVEAY